MGGNRGRDKVFGVECCATLHCDWRILMVRKIGETELDNVLLFIHLLLYYARK